MLPPTGEQFLISGSGYSAVVAEGGGALRCLRHHYVDLIAGFPEDEIPSRCRGQVLMPWPNRIRDGRYEFGGATQQLALTEPARNNASHGLARWVAWSPVAHDESSVELGYRLMAQTGYPWTLDLRLRYEVGAGGLTVTQSATNRSASPAPYASGAHPYLTLGGRVDDWMLHVPVSTRLVTDPERMLPVGREPVEGTPYDFRTPRRIGDQRLDHCFTDLERDAYGNTTVTVSDESRRIELWLDRHHAWLMLFTDDGAEPARRGLAIEPMTAPVDAFNSGDDLVVLAPAETFSASWGIRAEL